MSTRTVHVDVTAEHIAKGVRRDTCKCPVALALADALPGLAIDVDYDAIAISDPTTGLVRRFRVTPKIGRFILGYDRGLPTIKPFGFNIKLEAA